MGFMIGTYATDIFAEAGKNSDGFIEVDFLTGSIVGCGASPLLTRAVQLYRSALLTLCTKHGVEMAEFVTLTARYGTDRVLGPYFIVSASDHASRHSTDAYSGVTGRRLDLSAINNVTPRT